MESTDSVSKGYFVCMPKNQTGKKKANLPDPLSDVANEEWHKGYRTVWQDIEKKLNNIEDDALQVLLKDLVKFIQEPHKNHSQIPTVILLTGMNLPDHSILFSKFSNELAKIVTPHIVMLSSCDCTSIKQTIEQMICQFMKKPPDPNSMDEDESDFEENQDRNIKKSDCTMPSLVKWYEELNESQNQLIIVFTDFEGFLPKILCQLILILSGYIDRLPIILVFGVATTEAAVGESLTHKITSRLNLKVFQSQPSVYFLNNTVDKVFLSPNCPFQLSGKLFNFFTSIFLFYDFSVNRFIQGVKYCVMDHFYKNKSVSLLCQKENQLEKNVLKLNADCLKEIRNIPSFMKYIEESKDTKLTTDDEYTKKEVLNQLVLLQKAIGQFYTCLRVLYILVKDLPKAPFGKQFREIYCTSMTKDVTKMSEYKECHQLLTFLSKDELERKLTEIIDLIREENFPEIITELEKFSEELKNGLNTVSKVESPTKIDLNVKNRAQLKKKLAENSLKTQKKVGYEATRENVIDFIMNSFLPPYLIPYNERTVLWELKTIRDIDARNKVVPRIRGPVHTALNNPHHYLMCNCCKIQDDAEILATMPDICIAYKLHLEGGPLINLYDWLQSFSTILNPERCLDNPEEIDPTTQARFTQAVAELEFLGFIKPSKVKPDHVSRLTWGSSA